MSNPSDTAKQIKEVTIIVNGRAKVVPKKETLSFEEVVQLAFPGPKNENTIYTVTFKKGEDRKEGTMVAGDTVKVKDGMIFNVTPTDKS